MLKKENDIDLKFECKTEKKINLYEAEPNVVFADAFVGSTEEC